MKFNVTYQSNYNGCDVESDDANHEQCGKLQDALINKLYEFCDDDGCSTLDEEGIEEMIIQEAQSLFGQDVEVEVDIDGTSS